jgi:hypothetical protein
VVSAMDVAVITTWGGKGVVAGAVYLPVASIVPQPAPVHAKVVPGILQVTAWLALAGVTLALNCWTLRSERWARRA